MGSTSPTLLGRLRDPKDSAAWQEFQDRYGRRIRAWGRGKGLQESDASDVSQEVLLRVARLMQRFTYKPGDNFSGLLRTIWLNAWRDYVEKSARTPGARGRGEGEGNCPQELLSVPDEEFLEQIKAEIERDELHEALDRVQPAVTERDWRLFTEVDLGGRKTAEVASERGMTVAAAGMAVKRVRDKVKVALMELRGQTE